MTDTLADQSYQNSQQLGNSATKTTPIIFEGKVSEYFGICIVNLLLSLVTFGIYSAWAKVRRKKYFYNNTLIDNVAFDYHANPIAILKGRIIAFIIFAIYVYGKGSSPILAGVLTLLFFIMLPWLIVRGSLFNARNTSHRGLRFDFIGTVKQAARVFIGLPLLTILTLGLIWPYIAHEKSQFLMGSHRFGLSQFDMKSAVKQFYKVYAVIVIVPLIGILAAVAIPAYKAYTDRAKAAAQNQSQLVMPANIAAFAPVIQPKMLLATNDIEAVKSVEAEIKAIERVYSDSNPPPAKLAAEPAAEPTAELDTEPSVQEVPNENRDAVEKMSEQELAGRVAEMAQEDEAEAQRTEQQMSETQLALEWLKTPGKILFALLAVIAYLLFIFGFLGYLQARIGNLVWNNTTLDKLSFKSTLRARDFAWLYLSNIIVIALTFGLATPWAQIRMARYRASKLHIIGDVDFDQFVGDKKAEVKATGEEIAEMFDVDLSFG